MMIWHRKGNERKNKSLSENFSRPGGDKSFETAESMFCLICINLTLHSSQLIIISILGSVAILSLINMQL